MKVSVLMRWVGPAAIAGGVFLVFSDLSGLPITIPYLSTASPSGFDAVGSGLILVALTLLLVGMVGLYAKGPAPDRARVIEYGEAFEEDVPRRPVTEEVGQETAEELAKLQRSTYPARSQATCRIASLRGCSQVGRHPRMSGA